MPSLIDSTVGGSSSNSYVSSGEAAAYFDDRIPLSPPWVASGDASVRLILTATRVLDAMSQHRKTLIPAQAGEPAYYRIHRRWRGSAATKTQRLAWPRVGLFDSNGNPLNGSIVANSVANPTVIDTGTQPHNRKTGDTILVFGVVGSVPDINGQQTITVIDITHFSVPVNVTTGGTGGSWAVMPIELKEATSELAGQLLSGDRTLDNDVVTQGVTSVKAGSVSVSFKNNIVPQVLPDAVYNLMPYDWLTDEEYETALRAEFNILSHGSDDDERRHS